MKIFENHNIKTVTSDCYNYIFNKNSGYFLRFGHAVDEDPPYSPYGPEILDIELSTGGNCLGKCSFCYKCSNTKDLEHHMSLEEYKIILDKLPKITTQIALGLRNTTSNPDFWNILQETRNRGIVPNYTTHGLDITPEVAQKTAKLCGAVAVSVVDKEKTYKAVEMFTNAGMEQVNIHYMLAEETYDSAFEIIEHTSIQKGSYDYSGVGGGLSKLNAIVFLQYKPKGKNANAYHSIQDPQKYQRLIDYCNEKGVKCGFDSCSAPLYFKSIENKENRKTLSMYAEPCESGLFSAYINSYGDFFPCSFSEGEGDWKTGISVLKCKDFLNDVWNSERVVKWRSGLLKSSSNCKCTFSHECRSCPIFNITSCKKFNFEEENIKAYYNGKYKPLNNIIDALKAKKNNENPPA